MNNEAKFALIKQRVGGNREQTGFEYTFGMPRETGWHITPPNPAIRRILSELEFALRLDEVNGFCYTEEIAAALEILARAIETDGVLTKSVCLAAEEKLLPLMPAAKEYSLILCAHAHIDMNWMWGWNETVAAALSTFTTMLDLMDEYPDFTYSQSQTSVYRLVEEYDPEMMERIKRRIAEGRWEITSSAWVETDKNMPTGESLLNTIRYTRDYLENVWGVNPASLQLDFSPDTFGHSAHIPEIDTYAGIKYYYHCRGMAKDYVLYRYRSPSGAELLMYREPYWYNSAITPHIGAGLIDISRRMGGLKTGMIVYGVGNHGGGATRRDIERAYEMMDWKIYPNIRFGTFGEFFRIADKPEIREKLPVVTKELNCLFDGCYTTQTRIKRANRMAESGLLEAEAYSTFVTSYLKGRYNFKAFERAWQNTLFTHFHDILTGSNVQDSREYAMGLYQTALAHAETEETKALRLLSNAIDCSKAAAFEPEAAAVSASTNMTASASTNMTASASANVKPDYFALAAIARAEEMKRLSQSEGAGAGYGIPHFSGVPNPERGTGLTRVFNIFNPVGCERESICELTVWDWVGDMRRLTVTDLDGKPVSFARVDGDLQRYWDHSYFRVLVKLTLPAWGYTTVAVHETELAKYPFYYHDYHEVLGYENCCVLENEYIRAELDPLTMSLISLVDKSDNSEKMTGEFAGIVQINEEVNGNSAWSVGKYKDIKPVTDIRRADRFAVGGLKQGYRFDARVFNSTVNCEISLLAGERFLRYRISVDWNELCGRFVPALALRMPVGYAVEKYLCDIPMGVVYRESEAHDIPALTYTAAVGDTSRPLYLMTDSKYGFRAFDNTLSVTLLRSAHNPDPDPERGHHEIEAAFGIGGSEREMADISDRFCHPLRYVPTNPHEGLLPSDGVMLSAQTGTAHITSVTTSKNGGMLIRFSEISGKDTEVTVTLRRAVKAANTVDLLGNCIADAKADEVTVKCKVGAYRIAAVEVTLEGAS